MNHEMIQKLRENLKVLASRAEEFEQQSVSSAATSVVSQILFSNQQKIVVCDHMFSEYVQAGSVVNESEALNDLFKDGWRLVQSEQVAVHHDAQRSMIHVVIMYILVRRPKVNEEAKEVISQPVQSIFRKVLESTPQSELDKLSDAEKAFLVNLGVMPPQVEDDHGFGPFTREGEDVKIDSNYRRKNEASTKPIVMKARPSSQAERDVKAAVLNKVLEKTTLEDLAELSPEETRKVVMAVQPCDEVILVSEETEKPE